MSKPTVSLVVICGDGAVGTLSRLVRSVLDRPTGPMVDEVVVGWNGANDPGIVTAFPGIALRLDAKPGEFLFDDLCAVEGLAAFRLRLFRQKWEDDFGKARNEAHAVATCDWHFWLDADDVVCAPDDPQVTAELKAAGISEATIKAQLAATQGGSLRDGLEAVAAAGGNCFAYPYHYVVDGDMNPLQRQWKGRVLRWGDGFIWHGLVHEVIRETFGNKLRSVPNAGLLIRHLPAEPVRARLARNARLNAKVIASIKERHDELSHKEWYNLGALAFDDREWGNAIEYLQKAAEMGLKTPDGAEEGFIALDFLVRAFLMTRNFVDASKTAMEMLRVAPNRVEGYVAAIAANYAIREWSAVARWYDNWMQLKAPTVVAVENVIERNAWPRAWAAEAFSNLGWHGKAIETADAAAKLAPNDVMVARTLAAVRWTAEQVDAMQAVKTLVDFQLKHGDKERALRALEAAPAWEEDRFAELREEIAATRPIDDDEGDAAVAAWAGALPINQFALSTPHGVKQGSMRRHSCTSDEYLEYLGPERVIRLDLVGDRLAAVLGQPSEVDGPRRTFTIYAPRFNEVWTPEQARVKGIGGSEEAIIYLSEELVRRGHRVQVYGPSTSALRARVFNGVEYRRLEEFRIASPCDVLIAHRAPWIGHERPNCRVLFTWHHDHAYPVEAWNHATASVGHHLFVSDWQGKVLSELLPGVPLSGAAIGNGVPLEQCGAPPEKERHALNVCYVSQPIRGLSGLLEIWPEVLAVHPYAEMHVAYGFATNETGAKQHKSIADELAKVRDLLGKTERVWQYDRLGHEALMDLLRSSGVWAYPCVTGETRIAMPCNHLSHPYGVPIRELVGKSGFPVWCFDEKECRFTLGTVERVWETKRVSELVEIELDDGELLRVTPEHPIMDFDGEWHRADALTTGMRLMALHYRFDVAIKDFDGRWRSESRAVGSWRERRPLRGDEHVNHLDVTRLDNSPERLEVLSRSAHFHKTHLGRAIRPSAIKSRIASYRKWLTTPHGQATASANGAARANKFWTWMKAQPIAVQKEFYRRRARTLSQTMRKILAEGGSKAQCILDAHKRGQVTRRERGGYRDPAVIARANAKRKVTMDRIRQTDPEKYSKILSGLDAGRGWQKKLRHKMSGRNHQVVSVRRVLLDEPIPVYDITVETQHNFVANGVVVHNCTYPEVSAISGLRAAAAGCIPVFGVAGNALGETQPEQRFAVPEPWLENGKQHFLANLIEAIKVSMAGTFDREALRQRVIGQHTWGGVASRLLKVLAEIEASAGQKAAS